MFWNPLGADLPLTACRLQQNLVVTQLGGPSPLLYSAGKLDSDMANVHGPNVFRGCRPGQGRQAELAIIRQLGLSDLTPTA